MSASLSRLRSSPFWLRHATYTLAGAAKTGALSSRSRLVSGIVQVPRQLIDVMQPVELFRHPVVPSRRNVVRSVQRSDCHTNDLVRMIITKLERERTPAVVTEFPDHQGRGLYDVWCPLRPSELLSPKQSPSLKGAATGFTAETTVANGSAKW